MANRRQKRFKSFKKGSKMAGEDRGAKPIHMLLLAAAMGIILYMHAS